MVPMTSTPGRFFTVCAAALLTSAGVSGCGLLDGSSRVQEALEYLPDDATAVLFVDRAAIAERQGFEDIATGASEDQLAAWAKAQQEEGYGTELTPSVAVMQEAAFSDFDIAWEAAATSQDHLVRVWKLDEEADFDAIARDLEDAGYQRTAQGDADLFEIDLSAADATTGFFGGRYPPTLVSLALIPDENLIVSGDVAEGLAVVNDDEDSLADAGSFDDLLDTAPDQDALEYAGLNLDPTCAAEDDLERPRSMAYFAAPDEPLTGVRVFDDEDTAKDDENSLVTYLDGAARASGLDVDFDVTTDGETVIAEAGFDDRLEATRAWVRGDGPFACSVE